MTPTAPIAPPLAPLATMPPETPLAMRAQSFRNHYRDVAAPGVGPRWRAWAWRLATFGPAVATTLALVALFTDMFQIGGLSGFEITLITLIAVTFFWIALTVATASVGILSRLRPARPRHMACLAPQNVALLMPIHNEVPADVFGNACAMLEALEETGSAHRFTLFILSDSTDPDLAEAEARAFHTLRLRLRDPGRLYYRRRRQNTDRKVGNLADWVERWGGGYSAMLVLDADSLMSGEAIVQLTDELSADPSAGLIQSATQVFGAETLFGRVQQFSSYVYGAALADGLATWADREGNYWGHNAIIRTAAFAACAGLPKINTFRRRGTLILSHDFVEACLLRRAGWAVRIMPGIKGSYEEVPPTLIDYVNRDRRWCQGNLQHLMILAARGFHAVSRFHLFHGAIAYLMSPVWMLLLMVWAGLGVAEDRSLIVYFSGVDPRPDWPEMTDARHMAVLLFMYAMLLAPKMLGALAILRSGISLRDLGGIGQFGLSLMTEIVLSVAYAPIMMVQQTVAVSRSLFGIREGWRPQRGHNRPYGLWTLLRYHGLETLVGSALMVGIVAAYVSPWLLPIALSLALAVPLSALSGVRLTRFAWTARQLGTAEVFNAPDIIARARARRQEVHRALSEAERIPAE